MIGIDIGTPAIVSKQALHLYGSWYAMARVCDFDSPNIPLRTHTQKSPTQKLKRTTCRLDMYHHVAKRQSTNTNSFRTRHVRDPLDSHAPETIARQTVFSPTTKPISTTDVPEHDFSTD